MITRIAAAVVAVLLAALAAQTWRLSGAQQDLADLRLAQAEASQMASEAARMAERRISIQHNEIDTHAQAIRAAALPAADRAAVAGDGLRHRAAAVAAAADPAASGQCAGGAPTSAVLADVLGGMERHGRAVAAWADDLAVALDACQRAYQALMPAAPLEKMGP